MKVSGIMQNQKCISDESFKDTGLYYVWSLINRKYKIPILYTLTEFEIVRYNAIKRYIGANISDKMLTSSLRELEADGLVIRKDYMLKNPKVEYSLTERGKSLMPILDSLCEWGHQHLNS